MPKKMLENSAQPPDFESALAELEALVQRMENGDLALDAALREFERGVQLVRVCQAALQAAEQRVRLLTAEGQEAVLPPLEGG